MASLDVSAACIDLGIDADLSDLAIIFPGGAVLEIPTPPGIDVAFAIDYAKQILAAVSAALMPLQPIFSIIDTIMAIVDFAKAVPDGIAALDPGKIVEAIPKITAKLDRLLAMIPPLSIPIFLKSLLRVIIVMLTGLKQALNAIIDAILAASLAEARAAVVAEFSISASLQLTAAAECAKASASASMGGLAQGLKPLDALLKIVKLFVEMIGLPVEIPTIAELGADAKVAVNAIDVLIEALTLVRSAIPI